MAQPSPWLPIPNPGEVESAISRFAQGWFESWFANRTALICETVKRCPPPGRLGTPTAAVQVNEPAVLGLAACTGRGELENARDREVLSNLGLAIAADLSSRMSEAGVATADSDSDVGQARKAFSLSARGANWLIELRLHSAQIAVLRKCVAGKRSKPTLSTIQAAVCDQQVRLGCHLGHANLSASDLAAIAEGDLIVLDRRLDDSLPVTVEGNTCLTGQARIVETAQGLGFRLEGSLDLRARHDTIDA